jgi:hypothetical protein
MDEGRPRALTEHLRNSLRRFIGMSKLKRIALNIIAEQLTEQEIGAFVGLALSHEDRVGHERHPIMTLHAPSFAWGLDREGKTVMVMMMMMMIPPARYHLPVSALWAGHRS